MIIALCRKLDVACRCFGTLSDSQFSGKGLARSLLLTVLAGLKILGAQFRWQYIDSLALLGLQMASHIRRRKQ